MIGVTEALVYPFGDVSELLVVRAGDWCFKVKFAVVIPDVPPAYPMQEAGPFVHERFRHWTGNRWIRSPSLAVVAVNLDSFGQYHRPVILATRLGGIDRAHLVEWEIECEAGNHMPGFVVSRVEKAGIVAARYSRRRTLDVTFLRRAPAGRSPASQVGRPPDSGPKALAA